MQIISKSPSNWKELQQYVAEILQCCGFETFVEILVHTVRGSVEIDVLATRENGYKTTVLCECKHWNTAIPQQIIHGFRTIIADCGANSGLIISKSGFQKGAHEAVKNSNVELVDWNQFLDKFKLQWLQHVIKRNSGMGRSLQSFGLYLIQHGKEIMPDIYEAREKEFLQARENYSDYVFYSFADHYHSTLTNEFSIEFIDRVIPRILDDLSISTNSYQGYFDEIYIQCKKGIKNIEKIFDNRIDWGEIADSHGREFY